MGIQRFFESIFRLYGRIFAHRLTLPDDPRAGTGGLIVSFLLVVVRYWCDTVPVTIFMGMGLCHDKVLRLRRRMMIG